jgi:hypothetical protein
MSRSGKDFRDKDRQRKFDRLKKHLDRSETIKFSADRRDGYVGRSQPVSYQNRKVG